MRPYLQSRREARRQWLTPVIPGTQEAEIRIGHESLSQKYLTQKGLVAPVLKKTKQNPAEQKDLGEWLKW
jgi:hypothetical protein